MDGAIWTCPMHSQIRQAGPGKCPICGMALEPEAPSLDDAPNPELVNFTRRWWVSAALSVPLLALTMGSDLFGWHLLAPKISPWVQLALAAPVVLWAGAAFLFSLTATLAPGIFPDTFKMHGVVPVYYEAAAVVVALVLLGQVLELRARASTGKAIRALLNLAPKTAHRVLSSAPARSPRPQWPISARTCFSRFSSTALACRWRQGYFIPSPAC